MRNLLLCTSALFVLAGCDLSPDFSLPEVLKPAAFKEQGSADDTATVEPATDGQWRRFDDKAQIEEFAWWRMFHDSELDALMEQAMKDNPTLEAAMERVASARAGAEGAGAALLPRIGIGAGPVRQQQSPASMKPNMPAGTPITTKPYTLYEARGTISYELDLFGKNRATARAATQDAAANENRYRAARLTLQAELAQTYFRVLALRSEAALVAKTVTTREAALKLTQSKQAAGAVDTLAVSAMEADLANVRADAAVLAQSLATAEHALAVLTGLPPSELKLTATALSTATVPSVPAGLPSTLLERRPDIQEAAAAMAAANERIGVARSGYFPDISLSAMGGFTSGALRDLFQWSNRTWMIGPLAGTVLTQPIFEGGRVAAARAQAQAEYGAAVADYKAAVLTAFREVEDQLSGLRSVGDQATAVADGLAAATRSHAVASARYANGYASYLDMLEAERSLLAAQRAELQVRGTRYVTTIQLVRALGGSWNAAPEAPAAPTAAATE